MMIRRNDVLFVRRGRRIWFHDIVQAPTATSIMTSALRHRRTTRGSTRKYWAHTADGDQESNQQLTNPSQSNNLIYPSLSYRRLSLRRLKSARPRSRPGKASSATPSRVQTDVLAAYKASCMRKTRRPSPLNVGELQITSNHIHFTAHYLNSAPEDAEISLPFDRIVHIRRACYRRVLPHGVLIRCEGFPDYLMVLADRKQQGDVLHVLSNALRNTQEMNCRSNQFFADDNSSIDDNDNSTEGDLPMKGKSFKSDDEDLSGDMSPDENESSQMPSCPETCCCHEKRNAAVPELNNVRVESFTPVTLATEVVSKGKQILNTGPGQVKHFARVILGSGVNDHEHVGESVILLISATLVLFVSVGVVIVVSSLRTRVLTLTALLISQQN